MASNYKSAFEKWLPRKGNKSVKLANNVEKNSKVDEEPLKTDKLKDFDEKPSKWMIGIQTWKNENKTKLGKIESEIRACKEVLESRKQHISAIRKKNEKLKELVAENQVLTNQSKPKITKAEETVMKARNELCSMQELWNTIRSYETKQNQLTAIQQVKCEQLTKIYNKLENRYNLKISTINALILEIQTKKCDLQNQLKIGEKKLTQDSKELKEKKDLQSQRKNELLKVHQNIEDKRAEEKALEISFQERRENLAQVVGLLKNLEKFVNDAECAINVQFTKLLASLNSNEMRLKLIAEKTQDLQQKRLKLKTKREELINKSVKLGASIAERDMTLTTLSEKLKESEEKCCEQENKNKLIQEKLEGLNKKNEDFNLRISEVNLVVENSKRELALKAEEKDEQIAMLRDQVEEAKRNRDIARTKYETIQNENSKMTKELEYLKKKIATSSNRDENTFTKEKQHGKSKAICSTRKQLHSKKDDYSAEVYSMDSDTEDDSIKVSKQLSSSRKNYSKETKEKHFPNKNQENASEPWF